MRLATIGGLVLGAISISACASPSLSPRETAAPTLAPCGQVAGLDGLPADTSSQPRFRFCLQLEIPDSLGSPQTVQAVLISDQEQDPLRGRRVLIYHPGGPGVSPFEIVSADPPPVDYATYVVISWSGTTSSSDKGSCGPSSTAFGTGRTEATLDILAQGTADECRRGFGTAGDIGAEAAADELEVLRAALGQDSVDLLMISYGSAIGEAYLRKYPGRVARAVLDAPIGLEVPWSFRLTSVDLALRNEARDLLARCAETACASAAGAGEPLTFGRLRASVINTSPTVGSGNLTLTPVMFDQATELALRSEQYWDAYVLAVGEALSGDGTGLWSMGESLFFDLDRSVFYRSICSDIDHPGDVAGYVIRGQDLITAYATELAPCVGFPRRPLTAIVSAAERPDVLLVASPHDVLAPVSLLAAAPDLIGMSALCTTNVVGHTSFRDEAVRDIVVAFLRDGQASESAARCDATFR